VTAQGDLWLMRPDQFVRDPARWLECLSAGKACHTAAPNFGYAYAARRADPARLAGLDLSGWRTAIVGAEPIAASALESFARLAGTCGFSRRAFAPANGLAEATLAVTGVPSGQTPAVARPGWGTMRFGAPVAIERRGELGAADAAGELGWLVGCGPAHPSVNVTVVDRAGLPLPHGHLGEIAVTGASVAAGYHGDRPARSGSTRFAGGALYTGDAGFVLDGELYVVGRMGDSLKIRGRSVYVENLEAKVAAAAGLGLGRCAVVSAAGSGHGGVAVLVEAAAGSWIEAAVQVLDREVGDEHPVTIVSGQRGLIRRTSSGKPRRRYMWEQLHSGGLGGTTVFCRPPGG
jgi:fatty-acyl-CoA synthase